MFERLFAKRGLSLDRLRVLLEVREHGSIAKAAKGDPVRQSQYSRQLKELEEFFGADLTERKGRLLTLTPEGEELARLTKEHFVSLGNYARRLADVPVPVFLGAGESVINWLLIPLLPILQKDIAGVAIRMINCTSCTSSQIAARLASRDLDIGIVRSDAITHSYTSMPLGNVRYSLFVPLNLLKKRFEDNPEILLQQIPVASMSPDVSIGKQIYDLSDAAGLQMNIRMECGSFTGLAAALSTGKYASILPHYAKSHIGSKMRCFELPLLKPLTRKLSVAVLKRKSGMRPELERVQKWLSQHVLMPTMES